MNGDDDFNWFENSSDDLNDSLDSDDMFFVEQASTTLREVFEFAERVRAQGIDVIALLQAQPRDPAPAPAEDESQDQE
jgi:hypothetical protein